MLWASSGEMRSSESTHSTQSCFACSTANCFWRPKPSHSFCTTRAPWRAAISSVSSVLAESTMTMSSTKESLSRQVSRTEATLRVIRTAEIGVFMLSRRILMTNVRILFVKTSSLGDVVHHCPAVSDAARAFPDAQIDWVVEDAFAGIARMHASVRRVLPVALRRWRAALWQPSTWGEMSAFRTQLKAERYDAVIDTQGLLKSAMVTAFAHGRRHGMDAASARESIATRFYDVQHEVPRGLHAVERNRQLTSKALGFSIEGPPIYGLRTQPPSTSPYAVLLTMTSREDKLWPEARWIAL